jgi:hypothetical protein
MVFGGCEVTKHTLSMTTSLWPPWMPAYIKKGASRSPPGTIDQSRSLRLCVSPRRKTAWFVIFYRYSYC